MVQPGTPVPQPVVGSWYGGCIFGRLAESFAGGGVNHASNPAFSPPLLLSIAWQWRKLLPPGDVLPVPRVKDDRL